MAVSYIMMDDDSDSWFGNGVIEDFESGRALDHRFGYDVARQIERNINDLLKYDYLQEEIDRNTLYGRARQRRLTARSVLKKFIELKSSRKFELWLLRWAVNNHSFYRLGDSGRAHAIGMMVKPIVRACYTYFGLNYRNGDSWYDDGY